MCTLCGHHAGTGCPGLGIHYDVLIDDTRLQQRSACQYDGCCIASGVGHEVRPLDLVTEELRESVHGLLQVVDIRVLVSVPFLIDRHFVQAIISREVDGLNPLLEQLRDLLHGDTVGCCDEHEVQVLRV